MEESKQLKHAREVLDSTLRAIVAADRDAVAVADFLLMLSLPMITSRVIRGLWIEALYDEFPTLKEVDVDWKAFENAVLGLQKKELAMLFNKGEQVPVSDLTSCVSTTAFAPDMVGGPAPELPSVRSDGTYTFNGHMGIAPLGLAANFSQEQVVDSLHNEPSEETTPATSVHSPPATRNVNAPLSDLSIAMMSEETPPATSVHSAPAPRPVNPLCSDLSIAMMSSADDNASV